MHKKPKKTKAQEEKEDKNTRTKGRFAGEAGRVCMMMHCREVVQKNDVSEEQQGSKDELANKASPTVEAKEARQAREYKDAAGKIVGR